MSYSIVTYVPEDGAWMLESPFLSCWNKRTGGREHIIKADGGYLDYKALCGASFDGETKSFICYDLPGTATEDQVLGKLCPKCVRVLRKYWDELSESLGEELLAMAKAAAEVKVEEAVREHFDKVIEWDNPKVDGTPIIDYIRPDPGIVVVNPPPPDTILGGLLEGIPTRSLNPPGIEDTLAVDREYASAYNGGVMNTPSRDDRKQVLLDRAEILDQASEVLLATSKEARTLGLDLGNFTPRAVWREGKKLRKLSNRLKDKANSIT